MTLRSIAGLAVLLFGALGWISPANADEGMWTFDNFPSAKVQQSYGFAPDQAWLDNVRLASVRLARGCSGSFVSAQGLVMTNHHCAHSCIQQLSTASVDRVEQGFYAKRIEDEIKCPDIEVDQLTRISDVTPRVQAATTGKDGAAFSAAFKLVSAAIAKECSGGDDKTRCDVVNLYHGGEYALYTYRRYQDVRLVFAPEFAIAFFGGDPDNFEFPRYDLDVSYLRVYQDGKPLAPDHYFPSAPQDAKEGELTFVSGNPGSTSRDDTVAQLEYQRDVALPRSLFYLAELRGLLNDFSGRGTEEARIANDDVFGVENSFKALRGRFEALVDPTLIDEKRKAEQALRAKVAADPDLKDSVGPAWDAIAKALDHLKNIRDRYTWLEIRRGLGSELLSRAVQLVRHAEEATKPDGERLQEYTDANFPMIRQSLLAKTPIYPQLDKAELAFNLTKLREALGPDDPAVKQILGTKSPAERAAELVDGTKLADPEVRRQLLEGGTTAINASTDPMIVLVRDTDAMARTVRKDEEDNVDAVLKTNGTLIAKAKFKLYGTSVYPDATFSPRLSYGSPKSYQQHGETVPPFTTINGLYARATGSAPFKLPQSWLDARATLNPTQVMNMATNNDIIGGNSGSPVINRNAQIVGLIFDGDIQSLGGDFGFDGSTNRAVAVDIGALREAISKVYHADRLAEELKPKG